MAEREIQAKRIMLSAPKSGSGKTTLTCALLEVLKRRELSPLSFKCGPDYIDPLFHRQVLGIESYNLDTFFSGRQGVCEALADCGEKYVVAEGVMGLYDGMDASGLMGSCYEIAGAAGIPTVLVVDASKVGRTVISLIKGVLMDDEEHLIKGIILNRISEGFYESLKPVLEEELLKTGRAVSLLGYFPKREELFISSRHLGLYLPEEIDDIRKRIGLASDIMEKTVDMERLLDIMKEAPKKSFKEEESGNPQKADGRGLKLAVALDSAFCFYYRENLDLFRKRGVEIEFFSPLKDPFVPKDADGLLLGGGYPENHLRELASNKTMLCSVKDAIINGIPSLAECGGFMYLHKTIRDTEQNAFEMTGVLDGECYYTGHLVRFGYLKLLKKNEEAGETGNMADLSGMKGHEFHYYESTVSQDAYEATKPFKDRRWNCLVLRNKGIWGFPHFYYGSKPGFVDSFINAMRPGHNSRNRSDTGKLPS